MQFTRRRWWNTRTSNLFPKSQSTQRVRRQHQKERKRDHNGEILTYGKKQQFSRDRKELIVPCLSQASSNRKREVTVQGYSKFLSQESNVPQFLRKLNAMGEIVGETPFNNMKYTFLPESILLKYVVPFN